MDPQYLRLLLQIAVLENNRSECIGPAILEIFY